MRAMISKRMPRGRVAILFCLTALFWTQHPSMAAERISKKLEKVKKAEKEKKKEKEKEKPYTVSYTTVSVSYFSWGENVALANGTASDHTHANLLGNALNLEWERYWRPRYGF